MIPRPRLIVGNWKMHKTIPEAVELVKNLADLLKQSPPTNVTTVLAPPFTALQAVADLLRQPGLFPQNSSRLIGRAGRALGRRRCVHRGSLAADAQRSGLSLCDRRPFGTAP